MGKSGEFVETSRPNPQAADRGSQRWTRRVWYRWTTSRVAQILSAMFTTSASRHRGRWTARGNIWETMAFFSLSLRSGHRAEALRRANSGWSRHWLPGWAEPSAGS